MTWCGHLPEAAVPPFTTASAAPGSSAPSRRSPGAPSTSRPEEWLAWIADQPNLHDAINEAFAAGVVSSIVAYAVGSWEREHRAEADVNERVNAMFARWGH